MTRRRPLPLHFAVVPGWRPSLSAPPCSSSFPRGVRQARGLEVAGLRFASAFSPSPYHSLSLLLLSAVPLSREEKKPPLDPLINIRRHGRPVYRHRVALPLVAAASRHFDGTVVQVVELDGSSSVARRARATMVHTARRKTIVPGSGTRLLIFGQTGVAVWFLGTSGGVDSLVHLFVCFEANRYPLHLTRTSSILSFTCRDSLIAGNEISISM